MNEFEKSRQSMNQHGNRDHPEQYPTDEESLFDLFLSERTVDSIPVEELNQQVKDEKNKEQSKHTSSSANKYKSGFE